MTSATPRQQLKTKTSRLIEELELKWADTAPNTANSVRVLRRSPRLNKSTSKATDHRVQFGIDNPDDSEAHSANIAEPATKQSRKGTPHKPLLGSTFNAKADTAVNANAKSQSKQSQKKNIVSSSASIMSEASGAMSAGCSSKDNKPVFKRVDPKLALSPPPTICREKKSCTMAFKSISCDSYKPGEDVNVNTQVAKPLLGSQKEPSTASGRHVTFSEDVVFAAKISSSIVMRKSTPHKRNNTVGTTVKSPTINRTRVAVSPARTFAASPGTILRGRKTSKLLQTGAVRMNVAYYTNPRRKANGGTRLLDSGAVRKVVLRHTTPHKLVGNRHMWSPPPSTCKLKPRNLNQIMSTSKNVISTPLKSENSASKRSNASTGGHRFRAVLSAEKSASRVLFH